MIQKAEIKFKTFFDKDSRKKGNEIVQITVEMVDKLFSDLIYTYRGLFQTNYNTLEDHPLLRLIKSHLTANGITASKEGTKNCDSIKYDYLRDIASKTNDAYFLFVFKFVLLFRECINKFKKVEDGTGKEYCEVYGAESVPDLCNEFIIEFMEIHNYFGLNTDEEKNEFIEIIQHFCIWLYENGHTSSRLTLLI